MTIRTPRSQPWRRDNMVWSQPGSSTQPVFASGVDSVAYSPVAFIAFIAGCSQSDTQA
jgi:hypothetical protein